MRDEDPASRACGGPPQTNPPGNTGRASKLTVAMKGVGVTKFGGPDVLHVVELADCEAGPGQVRIRVRAAAVNPTDIGLRSGLRAEMFKDIPPPYVPGMDVAGAIDSIGPGGSADLHLGDHGMAIGGPRGPHGGASQPVRCPGAGSREMRYAVSPGIRCSSAPMPASRKNSTGCASRRRPAR